MGLDRMLPHWVPFDSSAPILNLGPGNKHVGGTVELDWPEWNAEGQPIPYEDGSVGGIIATHFLEHLADPLHVLREVGRVLKPGCPFNILVPHGQSLSYLQDLDHKTPFVVDTWKNLLDNPYYVKGKGLLPFKLGANFLFGLKEDNLALVTQLIRL
jgi:SAM-dependent methyltransferase